MKILMIYCNSLFGKEGLAMKKTQWGLLAIFTVVAAALRVWQNLTGFEESGLSARGNLPGVLLPLVLAGAAACFCLATRRLPARLDTAGGFSSRFRFRNMLPATCAISGAFLVFACAAASALGYGAMHNVLLSAFAIAAAFSVLYVVFTVYRGGEPQGVALLVPVCCFAVYLIFLYRADASDPVLAHIYVELLAISALAFTALERAAFAYGNAAPRIYVAVSALAVILSLTAAVDGKSLATLLLFVGCALVEAGFLAAADLEQ